MSGEKEKGKSDYCRDRRSPAGDPKPPRIVVVGVCGSGKSILVEGLRAAGYDAHAVAQEHSIVPELFLHLNPDLIIYLSASDETVAARKKTGWEHGQLEAQRRRLKRARQQAHMHFQTDNVEPGELVRNVKKALANRF